jgi:DNA-binding PadR family transcriptional regulator
MTTSTLGFAILGLLARQPCSGYELAARLRAPVGYYWTARHSQIYPELDRLRSAGLVSFETAPGPGPWDKKVYAATEAGVATLRDWVTRAPGPHTPRDELMLKVYAIWLADRSAAIAMVRDQADAHARRLAEYEAIKSRVHARHGGGPPAVGSPDFGGYATLMLGISHERDHLDWCHWLTGCLETGKIPQRP